MQLHCRFEGHRIWNEAAQFGDLCSPDHHTTHLSICGLGQQFQARRLLVGHQCRSRQQAVESWTRVVTVEMETKPRGPLSTGVYDQAVIWEASRKRGQFVPYWKPELAWHRPEKWDRTRECGNVQFTKNLGKHSRPLSVRFHCVGWAVVQPTLIPLVLASANRRFRRNLSFVLFEPCNLQQP